MANIKAKNAAPAGRYQFVEARETPPSKTAASLDLRLSDTRTVYGRGISPCTGSQLSDRAPFGEESTRKWAQKGPITQLKPWQRTRNPGVAVLSSALFLKLACSTSIPPTLHLQWTSLLTPTFGGGVIPKFPPISPPFLFYPVYCPFCQKIPCFGQCQMLHSTSTIC